MGKRRIGVLALAVGAGIAVLLMVPSTCREPDPLNVTPDAPSKDEVGAQPVLVGRPETHSTPDGAAVRMPASEPLPAEGEADLGNYPLRGRVVDAVTGEPVPDAFVFLWPRDVPLPEERSETDEPGAVQGVGSAQGVGFPVAADGRFAFSGGFAARARGGRLDLHVESASHVNAEVPVSVPGAITVRLERGGRIAGRVVTPDGRAVPEAEVWVIDARGASSHRSTVADGDGRFVVEGLAPGRVDVRAFGYMAEGVLRDASVGRHVGDVIVQPLVEVAFLVESLGDQDLPWYVIRTVDQWGTEEDYISHLRGRWESGRPLDEEDCGFKLWFAGSPARFRVYAPGHLTWQSAEYPLRGGPEHEMREIRAQLVPDPSAGTLHLRFPDGSGPAPLGLIVEDDRGAVMRRIWLAAQTREYEVTGLPPGPVNFRMIGAARVAARTRASIAPGASTLVEPHLERAATLVVHVTGGGPCGTVLKLDGGVVPGIEQPEEGERDLAAWVTKMPGGGRLTREFATIPGPTGAASRRIEGLPPGRHELTCEGPQRHEVQLLPGVITEVTVTLR